MERKFGGNSHHKLNMCSSPVVNKYHEGKVKRTLKRVLKVPELAGHKRMEPVCLSMVVVCLIMPMQLQTYLQLHCVADCTWCSVLGVSLPLCGCAKCSWCSGLLWCSSCLGQAQPHIVTKVLGFMCQCCRQLQLVLACCNSCERETSAQCHCSD